MHARETVWNFSRGTELGAREEGKVAWGKVTAAIVFFLSLEGTAVNKLKKDSPQSFSRSSKHSKLH